MTNTMTNETCMRNELLLTAAKADCEKRKKRHQRVEELKQLICWFLISMALLMVGLRAGYPEFFVDSGDTKSRANTDVVTDIEDNIVDASNKTQNEVTTESTPFSPYSDTVTEVVKKDVEENIETENTTEHVVTGSYSLSASEIDMLVQAVQHETGSNPDFYLYGDYDTVQQYMAASILNRIGQPGFGDGYTTPNSLYEVLANPVQYGNMIWELNWFDAYDNRTRNNVIAVLNGEAYTPENLYFERCSEVYEDYWSAQDSFYGQYGYNSSISIAYMSLTQEGRYIIFACNPNGAYAF